MSGVKGANAGEKHYRYIHGETHTRLHKIWESMVARCEYQKHPYFGSYGGRGITVCDEWHDYMVFREWAKTHGYLGHLTLDRVDNDLGYYPENCRWATMKEQQNNKRTSHRLTWRGETRTITEWAEYLGMNKTTIKERIRAGWSVDKALTVSVRRRTRGYRPSQMDRRE